MSEKNKLKIHADDKHWLDSFNSYWDCEYENDEEVSIDEIVEVNVIEDVDLPTAVERFNAAFAMGPAIQLLEVE